MSLIQKSENGIPLTFSSDTVNFSARAKTINTLANSVIIMHSSSQQGTNADSPLFCSKHKIEINSFGKDLIVFILFYLDIYSLEKCSRINKEWNKYSNNPHLWKNTNLKVLFPKVTFFDVGLWNSLVLINDFGSLEVEPEEILPLQKRSIISTLSRASELPIVEEAGITLLTMPAKLSMNTLLGLMHSLRHGHKIGLFSLHDDVLQTYSDMTIPNSYTVAITNDSLMQTQGVDFDTQANILEKCGGNMPSLSEALTLSVTRKLLFGDYPCDHKLFYSSLMNINGYNNLNEYEIKGSSLDGYIVSSPPGIFVDSCDSKDHHFSDFDTSDGLGAVWRF